jgi:hypothetical protein
VHRPDKKLVDYNQSKAGPRQFLEFEIFAHDSTQQLIGGLLGYMSFLPPTSK